MTMRYWKHSLGVLFTDIRVLEEIGNTANKIVFTYSY